MSLANLFSLSARNSPRAFPLPLAMSHSDTCRIRKTPSVIYVTLGVFQIMWEALQRPFDLDNLECLDDIARFDIIVFVNSDTALHAGGNLLGVILAALE